MLTEEPQLEGSEEEVSLATKISSLLQFLGIDYESDMRFEKAGGYEIPKLNKLILSEFATFNFIEDDIVISSDNIAELIYNQFSSGEEIESFLTKVNDSIWAHAHRA
jgi:hypothetical protein